MPTARRPRRTRLALGGGAAALALALVGSGAALGATRAAPSAGPAAAVAQPAITTFTPRSERQITNIDVLRQQIKNYYGDPLGTGTFDPDGNYAREAERAAAHGASVLRHVSRHSGHGGAQRAIVLDVDDTTLTTWNYEIASNFAYNPTSNGQFVTDQLFPAVPGMVRLVTWAAQHGYAVFYLTGRPTSQEAATLGNLTSDGVGVDAGYPAPTTLPDGEDGLFTKPSVADYPAYLTAACSADPDGKCTTVHYKSATRAHIESLGYRIVANFGDQLSDLAGGHARHGVKLPNPTYFLP